MPSKALLLAGETAWHTGHHPFAGVTAQSPGVDLAALVEAKDGLVATLRQAKYADLVDEYGFEVLPVPPGSSTPRPCRSATGRCARAR